MTQSRSLPEASARPDASATGLGTAIGCWSALKTYLEQRSRELNAEVRGYPTPIARCDDQLPKLLEQRSRANEQLRLAVAVDANSAAGSDRWAEVCRRILASPMIVAEDEAEAAIRTRLQAALAGLHHATPGARLPSIDA